MKTAFSLSLLVGSISLTLAASTSAQTTSSDAPEYTLEKVVVFSRHGIRAPLIAYDSELGQSTPHTWPHWETKKGLLTPKGAALESVFARYLRDWFSERQLLPLTECPDTGDVLVYTNSLPRTIESGESFVHGAFADCDIKVNYREEIGTMDWLFNPIIRSEVTPEFEKTARKQVDELVGNGGFAHFNDIMAKNFDELERVLDFKDSPLCKDADECSMTAVSNELSYVKDKEPSVVGPLRTGTGATDSFVLQYYEGYPENEVAWGEIKTPEQWQTLTDIKNTYTDVLFTTPLMAKETATPLLQFIDTALFDSGRSDNPLASQATQAKLTYLVGHDSNVGSLLSLLKTAPYKLPQQYEKTPISGKILFEKWVNNDSGEAMVKMEYVYQSHDQLRNGTNLTLDNPPLRTTLHIAGCPESDDGLCPQAQFKTAIAEALK